jgi:hypothetical protein
VSDSGNGKYRTIRKGVWHFQRRVPDDYAHLDKRGTVRTSTKIKAACDPEVHIRSEFGGKTLVFTCRGISDTVSAGRSGYDWPTKTWRGRPMYGS